MAMSEYRAKYPGSPLVCTEQREESSRKITESRRAKGAWFSEQAKASIRQKWAEENDYAPRDGTHHWQWGLRKLRGVRVPVEEIRAELEGYVADDLSLLEMAERCQVDEKSITNLLRHFGLQQGPRRGERNNRYLGGGSPKRRGLSSSEYEHLQQCVFERDHHTCQRCGQVGGRLEMHHVIPYRETQDNSIDNMTTLCAACHHKTENESGAFRKDPTD
jgi:hypothetical protein